jgi:hypothetical protein
VKQQAAHAQRHWQAGKCRIAGYALKRDGGAFRMIMERYNQRLYRTAPGLLRILNRPFDSRSPRRWSMRRCNSSCPCQEHAL